MQPRAAQLLDSFGIEQVAVGDKSCNDAVPVDAGDDLVQLGMKQRFSSTDGDDGSTQFGRPVYAPQHFADCDKLGRLVWEAGILKHRTVYPSTAVRALIELVKLDFASDGPLPEV